MFSNMLRYDKSCSTLCWAIFWMTCFGLHLAKGQMAAPTTQNILETSFEIVFPPFTDAEKYHAVVTKKHSPISRTICVTSSGTTIANLTGDTLYSVTIKPIFSDGTDVSKSPNTEFRTLPGSPLLYFNEILPNSVLIFFELPNYAAVSQYSVRYRIQGGDGTIHGPVDTLEDIYYVYRLSGLVADTTYEVSARALRLSGSTDTFTEAQTPFSPWQTVKTDSLSVFGRVNFYSETYNSNYTVEYSTEWNNTLSSIKNAYDASLYNSINIVRVENIGNIPRVHYQLKMKEKDFSGDASTYIITGTNFDNSLVNYGDKATGTVFTGETTSFGTHTITFAYGQGTRCTENYRENHVLISTDSSTTLIYRFNDLTSDSEAQGSAFLQMTEIDGQTKLINTNGFAFHTFNSHTVFGLTPKYLIQDCLKNQAESLFSLYHDADQVIVGQEPPARLYSTEFAASLATMGEALYNFSSDGTTAYLYVPAVKKAIKYTVLNDATNSILGELDASGIDASDYQKISLESLTNGNTYAIKIRVTARQHDDGEVTADSDVYTFTTSGNQCSVCDSNAICFTERFSNPPTCQCDAGFTGNGTTCTQINYCNPSSCHVNATCDELVVTCEGDATHSCKCKDGFSGDGTSCTDVVECDTNNGGCHENATCTNTIGSFSCECKNGFSGDGTLCTDVIECDTNHGDCHENATCTNTIGTFSCECKNGFSGDGTSCTDVVECDTNNGGCHENATCTNTRVGSITPF